MKKIHFISRTFNLILLILLSIVLLYISNKQKINNENYIDQNSNSILKKLEKVKLIKIIDGDTIKVKSLYTLQEFKIRLIGIDTPETKENKKLLRDITKNNQTKDEIIRMGITSKEFTKNLLLNSKYLYLEYDIQIYDKYNRRLAYVYLENGQMLNYILVREGYAKVYTIPPNVKYQDKLLEAQRIAIKEKKGLWKKE